MGVEPFLVCSALDAVVAQRLARRLCDKCKEPYQPTEAELTSAGWPAEELADGEWPTLWRAIGCPSCGRTGYRGRFGVHEILLVTEEMRKLVAEHAHADALKRCAVESGMLTLRQAGASNVARGYTSIEELIRVVV
jgi:type IV pilus assembly protein PilB